MAERIPLPDDAQEAWHQLREDAHSLACRVIAHGQPSGGRWWWRELVRIEPMVIKNQGYWLVAVMDPEHFAAELVRR